MKHHLRSAALALSLFVLGGMLAGCADTFVADVEEAAPRVERVVPVPAATPAPAPEARTATPAPASPAETGTRSQPPERFRAATETHRFLQRYRLGQGYRVPPYAPLEGLHNGLDAWSIPMGRYGSGLSVADF